MAETSPAKRHCRKVKQLEQWCSVKRRYRKVGPGHFSDRKTCQELSRPLKRRLIN